MRQAIALLVLLALLGTAGCEDSLRPELPQLQLRIVYPLASDSLFDRDTVGFAGEAVADDVGLIPDDSLWWEEDGIELGRGRLIQHVVRYGARSYTFKARYSGREGSASVDVTVHGSVGRVRWVAPLLGASHDGLAMSPDGVIYARDGSGRVVAIAPDGTSLWHLELPFSLVGGPPAIGPDGTIYYSHYGRVVDEEGGVVAITHAGSIKWIFYTELNAPPGSAHYHIHGSMAVDASGSTYFGTEEYGAPLYGVNPDGSLKWRVEMRPNTYRKFWGSTVLLDDSLAISLEAFGLLVAVHTETGAVVWTDSLPAYSFSDHAPAIGHDGTIYIAKYSTLYALSPLGTEKWRRNLAPWGRGGGPVLGGDRLYLRNSAGGVLVATITGEALLDFGPSGESFDAWLTLGANGVVYVAAKEKLYSYDKAGNLRFAITAPGDSAIFYGGDGPLIGPDGTIYVRTSNGVVAVRDTVGPDPEAAWPTFQGGPMRQGRRAR